MLHTILQSITSFTDRFPSIFQNGETYIFVGLAGINILALATEPLLHLFPIKDKRIRILSRLFNVPTSSIAPIGDGLQLWREARSLLPQNSPQDTAPLSSPTFQTSFLINKFGQLYLVCIHSTTNQILYEAVEDNKQRDAAMNMIDHKTGNAHRAIVSVDADLDCVQRTNALEAIANFHFGYKHKIVPILLWKDPEKLAPEPDGEITLSGLAPVHLNFQTATTSLPYEPDSEEQISLSTSKFLSWIKNQPVRSTPKINLILRILVTLLCLGALTINQEQLGSDELNKILGQIFDLF